MAKIGNRDPKAVSLDSFFAIMPRHTRKVGVYMNNIKIFEENEFNKIKDLQKEKPNSVVGIIYAIGYGNRVSKIGMSSFPANRTSILTHYINDYMQCPVDKILISPWHTNYKENEKKLHQHFSKFRIPNTEVFTVSVDQIAKFIVSDKGILFEDNSEEILKDIEQSGKALIEFGKSLLRGDFYSSKSDFEEMYDAMLDDADSLTEEIIFTARVLVDDYRAALEDNMEAELSALKARFVEKWIEHGLIDENAIAAKNLSSQ